SELDRNTATALVNVEALNSLSRIAAALADSESGSMKPPPLTALGALGASNPPTTTSATSQIASTIHRQRTIAAPSRANGSPIRSSHRVHDPEYSRYCFRSMPALKRQVVTYARPRVISSMVPSCRCCDPTYSAEALR